MRIHTTLPVRRGVTLVEVLVAIFVMALGLMALLTLFPLGALNMAQAIKDDRTGTSAHNAASIARVAWKQGIQANPLVPDPDLARAMLDPDADPGRILLDRSGQDAWSYPVFVDAIGWTQYPGPAFVLPPGSPRPANSSWRFWMAGDRGRGLPRATLTPIRTAPGVQQVGLSVSGFTFRDDMTFDENAVGLDREGLYSWAYVLQMSSCVPPFTNVADMKVVVYRRRAQGLSQDTIQAGEAIYSASFGFDSAGSPNPKIVTLTYAAGQDPVAVRRGGWIADVTLSDPRIPVADPRQLGWKPRAFFYRVVNIAEINPTTVELELQTEVKANTPAGTVGTCAVLENVVEVFDKGGLQ